MTHSEMTRVLGVEINPVTVNEFERVKITIAIVSPSERVTVLKRLKSIEKMTEAEFAALLEAAGYVRKGASHVG